MITWLHLSDLHLCAPKTGWETDRILGFLIDDLKKMEQDHGLKPDLLLVTGDLAFGELGEGRLSIWSQFDNDVWFFLEEIRAAFRTPIPAERVFIVPGNHDVDRTKVLTSQTHYLDSLATGDHLGTLKTIYEMLHGTGNEWSVLMQRLAAYKAFLGEHYPHLLQDEKRLCYAHTLDIHGHLLGIAGLNSAWSCRGKEEKGRLWLGGEWQLNTLDKKLTDQGAEIKLVLAHHPLNWLVAQEDPRLNPKLQKDFDFFLHGHEHFPWVSETPRHIRLSAGACYGATSAESGYNIARLDPKEGKGEVWLRRFDDDKFSWVPLKNHDYTDENGLWPLDLGWLKPKEEITESPATPPVSGSGVGWISEAHPPRGKDGGCVSLIHPTARPKPKEKITTPSTTGVAGVEAPATGRREPPAVSSRTSVDADAAGGSRPASPTPEPSPLGRSSASGSLRSSPATHDLSPPAPPKEEIAESPPTPPISDSGVGWISSAHPPRGKDGGCVSLIHPTARPKPKEKIAHPSTTGVAGGAPQPTDPDPSPPDETEPQTPDGPESRGVYGRGPEITKLAAKLAETPILLVHGIAGVGKSRLIEEIRHGFNRAGSGGVEYKPITIRATEHLSADEIFEQLAPTLGCFDDEPKAPRELGRLDLSALDRYQAARPAIVHIYRAHAAFTESGFVNSEVPTFLRGLVKYLPQFRVILESTKRAPEGLFAEDEYHRHRVWGLDNTAVAAFFRRPFPKRPQTGWALAEEETHAIYDRLGGRNKNDGAHPLGLMLLAVVAEGLKCNPYQALQRHPVVLREKLEEELFQDLYENVLTPPQQHLLRLAALYRQSIPVAHEEALNRRVGEEGAFQALVQRFLLSPDEREERFELHTLFAELARTRIDQGDFDYQLDHGVIAEEWLATVRGIRTRRLPYLLAANEAAHHLLEAEEFHRLDELSVTLLGRDTPALLAAWYKRLFEDGDREKQRPVLELLTKLLPEEAKYHRFLGETIEKLEGRGVDEALAHYLKAHKLAPTYPQYLANLGRCWLARGEPEQFVARVEALSAFEWERVVNVYVQDIHARCLERVGRGEAASALRQEWIGQGARNPALYNDEAIYLQNCQRHEDALRVLEKAEERGAMNDHLLAVKAGILQAMSRGEEASAIRRDRIAAGTRDPIFYNDEALYRWEKLNDPAGALAVLEEAKRAGVADDHILSVRGRVLEALGRGQEASRLRRGRIAAGTQDPALYNDEALYLKKQGDFDRALAMLDKARARGCEDEHIRTLRASIERQ